MRNLIRQGRKGMYPPPKEIWPKLTDELIYQKEKQMAKHTLHLLNFSFISKQRNKI